MPLRPPRLEPGDTIALAAPAGPILDPVCLDRAVARLEQLGYRVLVPARIHRRRGYLAGSDRERLSELHRLFRQRRIKAILCVRGGYGSARLLPQLDYQLVRAHPKIFVGYSDITALHCALQSQADLVTFHGPMAGPDLGHSELPEFTLQNFLRAVTWVEPIGVIRSPEGSCQIRTLYKGRAIGRLVGGNLSVLVSLLGTPFLPDFRGRILCLEEVGEPLYRVDRMLTQLDQTGLIHQVAGIAIGTCERCEDTPSVHPGSTKATLEQVCRERLKSLRKPVLFGLPFGHTAYNVTLPLHALAELDADQGSLRILEPGVS
ncbi:MAG: LD-carboxypeptidase [Verrucomicrobiota bacterium]|nr:LD-carboxypeptidase [Limisphaera sp.]MDW8382044.1 LD-carboxypeptidase [Verrucomicrobiota bacterium]